MNSKSDRISSSRLNLNKKRSRKLWMSPVPTLNRVVPECPINSPAELSPKICHNSIKTFQRGPIISV